MTSSNTGDRCAVIGAGIAGVACAHALSARGISVDLLDRGQRLGGRIAAMTLRADGPWQGRVIDMGASYPTVTHPDFQRVMDDWVTRGLAREWTNVFHVMDDGGARLTQPGPMRYAAPAGLRSLMEDLASQLPEHVRIRHPHMVDVVSHRGGQVSVDGQSYAAAALAMPDPQAQSLLTDASTQHIAAALTGTIWQPSLALAALYPTRWWSDFAGMFVNNDAVIEWVADDGDRRGDGAPVLVAHSSAEVARAFYDDPTAAAETLLAGIRAALSPISHVTDMPEPIWHTVKRWGLAKPDAPRQAPFHWDAITRIGVAGDGWHVAPGDRSRVESAWLSGRALGEHIAATL